MLHCNHTLGPPSCWLDVVESGTWLGFKVTGVKSEPDLKVAGSLEAPVGVKAPDLIEGCGGGGAKPCSRAKNNPIFLILSRHSKVASCRCTEFLSPI